MVRVTPIHAYLVPGLHRKFDALVDKGAPDECWMFLGDRGDRGGYGRMKYHGRTYRAHRLALTIKLGRDIAPGLQCQHLCDVKGCVNPKHLTEGDTGHNSFHAMVARKHVHGSRIGNSKMTETTAAQAWARLQRGEKAADIAAEMGVSRGTIQDLALGRGWRHVTGLTRQRTRAVPLPLAQMQEIADQRDAGLLLHEIAQAHGISIKTVREIVRRQSLPTPTPHAPCAHQGQGHTHSAHPAQHGDDDNATARQGSTHPDHPPGSMGSHTHSPTHSMGQHQHAQHTAHNTHGEAAGR